MTLLQHERLNLARLLQPIAFISLKQISQIQQSYPLTTFFKNLLCQILTPKFFDIYLLTPHINLCFQDITYGVIAQQLLFLPTECLKADFNIRLTIFRKNSYRLPRLQVSSINSLIGFQDNLEVLLVVTISV